MKVGDRIMVLGRERAGEILSKEIGIWGEFFKVKVKDGGVEYFWPFQLYELTKEEKSGIKVGDTVEVTSRIQRGKVLFINYYVVVDVHGEALAYHPDELRLIKEEITGCEKDCLGCGKCFVLHPDKLFPCRTICPVCHTNHEV